MDEKNRQAQAESLQNLKDQVNSHKTPLPKTTKPRNLAQWQSAIEEKIQKAMAEGYFDNLPGNGKPLNLDENSHADPGEAMAMRILKNSGFAPEWIEEDKEIRNQITQAQDKLERAWQAYQNSGSAHNWQVALGNFEGFLAEINRRINNFNLTVPILSKQRMLIRLEDELERLMRPG